MGSQLKSTVASFLTIRFAVQAVQEIATATMEAEQATARLEGVLLATGHSAGITAGEIDDLATAMQKNTLFDDEDVKNSAAALATFSNVSGEMFRTAIKLAGDLSAVFGGGLQENAVKLGKALDSPLEGLGALSKMGVRFNATEKEHIKTLLEHNQLAEAQAVVLQKVTDKVGGAAEAMGAKGLTGAVDGLKDSWHDLMEEIGDSRFGDIMAEQAKFTAQQFREMGDLVRGTDPRSIESLTTSLKAAQAEIARFQKPSSGIGRDEAQERWLAFYTRRAAAITREIALLESAAEHEEIRNAATGKPTKADETPEAKAKREADAKKALADAEKAGQRYRALVEESVADNIMTLRSLREWRDKELAQQKQDAEEVKKIQDDLLAASLEVDEARVQGAHDAALADVKIWNNAIENIQSDWADSFADMLTGQITTFREFLRTILTDFARTMTQMGSAKLAAGIFGGFMQSALTLPAGGPVPFGGFNISTSGGGAPAARVTNIYNISAVDSQSFAQAVQRNSATVTAVVTRSVSQQRGVARRMARGTD